MKLAFVLEQRFLVDHTGVAWTPNAYSRAHWDVYLQYFDAVHVVARAERVAEVPQGHSVADGDGVRLMPVPYYVGPVGFARQLAGVRRAVKEALDQSEAVILRTPGMLAAVAYSVMREERRPYGVHVVGDPYDVYAPGAIRHPARPFFRWWFSRQLRKQCADSAVATYVTAEALQRRYPPGPATWTTHFSDVELGPDALAPVAPVPREASPFEVVTVGSLDQPYKGVDVLIDALRRLRDEGMDVRLRVVGDGRLRPQLEAQAVEAGLQAVVHFVGNVAGPAVVRAEVERADLMVVASRTEGLPRVLLEAMALGLPCVGTAVGGIPELLPPEALVPPNDAAALADRLKETLQDPGQRARMGRRNLELAGTYTSARTEARQGQALEQLRAATTHWLDARPAKRGEEGPAR